MFLLQGVLFPLPIIVQSGFFLFWKGAVITLNTNAQTKAAL